MPSVTIKGSKFKISHLISDFKNVAKIDVYASTVNIYFSGIERHNSFELTTKDRKLLEEAYMNFDNGIPKRDKHLNQVRITDL